MRAQYRCSSNGATSISDIASLAAVTCVSFRRFFATSFTVLFVNEKKRRSDDRPRFPTFTRQRPSSAFAVGRYASSYDTVQRTYDATFETCKRVAMCQRTQQPLSRCDRGSKRSVAMPDAFKHLPNHVDRCTLLTRLQL